MLYYYQQQALTEDQLIGRLQADAQKNAKWFEGSQDPKELAKWGYIELMGQGWHIVSEANYQVLNRMFKRDLAHGSMYIRLTSENATAGQGRYIEIWVKIFRRSKSKTVVWNRFLDMLHSLDNYPYLSSRDKNGYYGAEDIAGELELEATLKNIKDEGKRVFFTLDTEPPETDWVSDTYHWLSNTLPEAVESKEDQGGYLSDVEFAKAFVALGYYKGDEELVYGKHIMGGKLSIRRVADDVEVATSETKYGIHRLSDNRLYVGLE